MKNHIQEIMRSPLFAGIKKEDLGKMLECIGTKIKQYRKGEIIILTNDEVQYVGIVLNGSVHMVIENNMGDQTLLSIVGNGELFGESFACAGGLASYATFVAAEHTTVLFMPFQKVLHSCSLECAFHHQMIENMVIMIANKNVRLMQKIDVSSQKTIREKLLTYLKILAKEQNSRTVKLPISRTILAEYLGVNRSALSRELTLMKKDGIVDFEKNKFCLKEE